MKISLVTSNSGNLSPWIPELKKQGIEVLVNSVDSRCDFIVCATNSQLSRLRKFHKAYPNIKIICYAWDLYEWIWTHPRGYDWSGFGDFLKKSVEIWVPSKEVALRAEEYFGVGDKCQTIHTFARFFETERTEVVDKRFIYNPLRAIPDRNFGWLNKVCENNKIPLYTSGHRLSEEEFRKKILECSFMVCEYYEASTGGLTLLEGCYHGKPCIISDSPYMGAKEYLGDNGIYFKHDDYEDFERVVLDTWNNTPVLDIVKTRKDFKELTIEKMVKKMVTRLEVNKK